MNSGRHGSTAIEPRAIERIAEIAARANLDVTASAGRLGDEELTVGIAARCANAIGFWASCSSPPGSRSASVTRSSV